jgi:CysZ protein
MGALVWALLGAWVLSLEYLDCVLGNQVRPFPVALQVAREHRSMALGLGAGLALLTAIPVLNFLAMPIGVAAATVLYDEHLRAGPVGS